MSLRERKKARTQDAILQAAAELFGSGGYPQTTVEEIAERAEVGVGTVYNYFGSKRGLLIAWMVRMGEEALERGSVVAESATDDPEKALSQLVSVYMEGFLELDRELMREVFAATIAEPESIGKDMVRADYQLINQMAGLMRKFQESGQIAQSLPVMQASVIVYSVMGMLVMAYVQGEIDSRDSIMETISSNISLIFRDWRAK